MSELEEKLGAILGNPQMMQQIMTLAQSMGSEIDGSAPPAEPVNTPAAFPALDPVQIQRLSALAGGANVDSHQQALLQALGPYISQSKVGKLERAMRAAKMAKLASGFLGQNGIALLTGR